MSEGVPYADIIILALIAGFILLRLRSVLGKSDEDGPPAGFGRYTQQEREPIVQLDEKSLKTKPKEEEDTYMATLEDKAVAEPLTRIKDKDPEFSASEFLDGAKMAYEMVFDAFAKGEQSTLKMLLSDSIFKEFQAEIEARAKSDRKTETTLVSVSARDITQASLEKNTVRLTVKFVSEQVILVKDDKGKVIEGDPSEINHVEDLWAFERDVTSKNPNWKIIET